MEHIFLKTPEASKLSYQIQEPLTIIIRKEENQEKWLIIQFFSFLKQN